MAHGFVKLSKQNKALVDAIIKDSKNDDLNVNWVGNVAVEKGARFARRKFVKTKPVEIGAAERRAA